MSPPDMTVVGEPKAVALEDGRVVLAFFAAAEESFHVVVVSLGPFV